MTGTCHCQLPAEQGSPSKEAQVLSHRFSMPTSVADQERAGGALAPTVGTDEPTNDTHRPHSPDDDGIRAMGLISSG
jgi:hypothetical protein